MGWDYLKLFGVVGIMTFAILFSAFIRDNWFDSAWHGLNVHVTFKQIFIEWAACVVLFAVLFMVLQGVIHLACSFC